MEKIEIPANEVSKRIYTLRGCQVMLDSDLARIYEVEPRALKQAVKRNIERFPIDFMFELTHEELENLRSQSVISSLKNSSEVAVKPILRSQIGTSSLKDAFQQHGGTRYMPFAFTEPGVAMLSSVLHSQRAIQVNIEIMRVFIQLRKQPHIYQPDLVSRIESLEKRFDQFEIQRRNEKPRDPVNMIQNIVARHWGLKVEDLKSTARTKAISLPRQLAIYLVRKQMQMSFSEIGWHFGRRDHTTILHAYRKIDAAFGVNNMIQEALHFLQSEVRRQSLVSSEEEMT